MLQKSFSRNEQVIDGPLHWRTSKSLVQTRSLVSGDVFLQQAGRGGWSENAYMIRGSTACEEN